MSAHLLPSERDLDISALCRLFRDATNSYKFLFFQGAIHSLIASNFERASIQLNEVGVEMLRIAWYPHAFFRLSFGSQDRISCFLDALRIPREEGKNAEQLRTRISEENPAGSDWMLLRYVPYRLLAPFFERELKGVSDTKKNALIEQLAEEYFDEIRPLYRFRDEETIEFHPDWLAYLKTNIGVIQGWMHWEWLCYLQRRNPNVPAISSKLSPPPARQDMRKQREFWRVVIETKHLNCIYTDKPLNSRGFALDHFLPWSFVAHNQLWNLVPVTPEVNSTKGDRIPSDEYLDRLIHIQHQGLVTTHVLLTKRSWTAFAEGYISDLRISDIEGVLDLGILRQAYETTVPPLMLLAESIGFPRGWRA
ncbi:HNH endonuclease domain-containing protein [Nitrosococcus wardiae]|uniref:HNH nuclease domain-containing protein n=1 Tax=Nitrosococcus wardiae TaxID=1814290 RepID=A0A4P7BX87_9GAMM|nr:HNH endonuclease domain-containing protein [Nitrosococcus wardiae]QBQ53710.1 hypothetical protein E3U44_03685 [Nitrosococcus wardiae]